MWILVGVSIVILTWSLFWLPYVARFEDKTWTVIKNTRIIMIQNLAWSFIILVLTVALGLFICAFFPIGMIGATAVYMAITGKIYYKVFRKYMTAEAIAEEDNDIIPI